jgi:hypothetical protein
MWPFRYGGGVRSRRVRRVVERHATDLLRTDLGEVVDMSGYGMRVRADARPRLRVGDRRKVSLRWADCRLVLDCRVAWVARTDDRGTLVGLAFAAGSPRLRSALAHLAEFGFVPGPAAAGGDGTRHAPRRKAAPPDYYRLLGVHAGATEVEVKKAYYRLAQRHHPDASRAPGAATTFQLLAEAYRTLRDAEARRLYDDTRRASTSAQCAYA